MADVNGDLTPSGNEVELVSADEWANMNVSQLFDQRIVLNNRLAIVSQYGNPGMIKQIQMGIQQLDVVLQYKENRKSKKNKKEKALTGLI